MNDLIEIEVHHLDGESAHGTMSDVEVSREEWNACTSDDERRQLLFEYIEANANNCSGPWAIVGWTIYEG